jgi:hypothetical protein
MAASGRAAETSRHGIVFANLPHMIDTEAFDPAAYVAAVAPAMGFRFSPERARAVADALALVTRVAAPALSRAVPHEAEPAPLFTP